MIILKQDLEKNLRDKVMKIKRTMLKNKMLIMEHRVSKLEARYKKDKGVSQQLVDYYINKNESLKANVDILKALLKELV